MTTILAALAELGALITDDHLVYTSGRHGSTYVNKDALYPHTAATSSVGAVLAEQFADEQIDVVAGPTVGGVIMAQWTAHHLTQRTGRDVLAVYAEEEIDEQGKRRVFRRGYDDLVRGRRVLVVEDILTTGGSARMVVDAVRTAACPTSLRSQRYPARKLGRRGVPALPQWRARQHAHRQGCRLCAQPQRLTRSRVAAGRCGRMLRVVETLR